MQGTQEMPPHHGMRASLALAALLCSSTAMALVDSDGDGVPDQQDNCTLVSNADQRDTNGDGIGNACDPDLTEDCIVNSADLTALKAVFFTNDPDADFDGNGFVNFVDVGVMKSFFFQAPGPSGVPNDCSL